jgi:hypothetical protein
MVKSVFEFINFLYAEGLSDARVLKYLSPLNILSKKFGKLFSPPNFAACMDVENEKREDCLNGVCESFIKK